MRCGFTLDKRVSELTLEQVEISLGLMSPHVEMSAL